MAGTIAKMLYDKIGSFLGQEYKEFGCLNFKARNKLICRVAGDLIIPPAAAFSLLKKVRYVKMNKLIVGGKAAPLSRLKPRKIKMFATDQIKSLNFAQLRSLSSAQIKRLKRSQIKAFTPEQLKFFTLEQIASFNNRQLSALSKNQVQALSLPQIKALTPRQLNESRVLTRFSDVQTTALTETQLKAFSLFSLRRLGDNNLLELTGDQVRHLGNKLTNPRILLRDAINPYYATAPSKLMEESAQTIGSLVPFKLGRSLQRWAVPAN